MIEEIGTIVELRGKQSAVVLCKKSTLCENCASSGSCSIGDDDDRSRLVEAHNPQGAVVGDRVRIVTSTKSFLHSSFLLYIAPLIALVIGAVIGKAVGEHLVMNLDANLLSAIFGVFFLVGSFVIIRVGSNALNPDLYKPRIVEVLPDET